MAAAPAAGSITLSGGTSVPGVVLFCRWLPVRHVCARRHGGSRNTLSPFPFRFCFIIFISTLCNTRVFASCQAHSSASTVASCAAAGLSELENFDKYDEESTTPDATAVIPTSSLCRASPRFSDHLMKQGPTLMVVSSLPLER